MIKLKLIRMLLLASVMLVLDANAQVTCDDSYNSCVEKCDAMENPSDTCYSLCDETYVKCLESEQSAGSEQYLEAEEYSEPEEK